MTQNDPKLLKVLGFWQFRCNFCKISEKFHSKFQNNQLNNNRTSSALRISKRPLQRFASKTLQNDSKAVEKLQQIHFCGICVLLESFWSQIVGKRSTNFALMNQLVFKGLIADFSWKMAQNLPQKIENV